MPGKTESLVGQTVWRFEENYRVYAKEDGRHGPIYREHWRPYIVTGETPRSWIAGKGAGQFKIQKAGNRPGFALTAQEVDENCWVNENRWKVVHRVERCSPAVLRRIAALVGFVEGA